MITFFLIDQVLNALSFRVGAFAFYFVLIAQDITIRFVKTDHLSGVSVIKGFVTLR